jgi:hypothetical protein
LLGCASVAFSATYEPAPFAHYQPILDRMPFGAVPANINPGAAIDLEQQKTEEQLQLQQQQVAKRFTFSALNLTPRGTTAVGFTDLSVNPPASYYLEVGASSKGWTVVAADYDGNWAQFEKEGVTITMHLDRGLIDGPPSDATAAATNPPPAVAAAPAPLPPRHTAPATTAVSGLVRRPALAPPIAAPAADTPAKSFSERLRERAALKTAENSAVEKANIERMQELARKIAQDELAKQREQEAAEALTDLRLQQEQLQAHQLEALAKEQEAELPQGQEEPVPEQEPEEQ